MCIKYEHIAGLCATLAEAVHWWRLQSDTVSLSTLSSGPVPCGTYHLFSPLTPCHILWDLVFFSLQNTDYMMSVCSTECDRSNIFVCFLKEKNSQYVYPNNTWRLRLIHWFYAHALVQYIAHIHCRMSHIHSVYKEENPLWCGSQIGFVIIFSPYDNVVWLCVYNVLQVTKAGGWTRSSEQSSG